MATKINKRFISNLTKQIPDKDVLYTDTVYRGFAVKHTPTGRIVYMVYSRIKGGRPYKKKLGEHPIMSLEGARTKALELMARIKQGEDPEETERRLRPDTTTFRHVFEDYLKHRRLSTTTLKQYRTSVERHLDDWLELPIQSITRRMVEDRFHEIIKGAKRSYNAQGRPGQAHAQYVFRIVNAVCRYAMAEELEDRPGEYLLRANPVAVLGEKRLRHSTPPRQRKLELNVVPEYLKLTRKLACADTNGNLGPGNEVVADYVQTLLLTGMRSIEARTMTWSMVKWPTRSIEIPMTKTRNPLVQPMSSFLFDIMQGRAEQAKEHNGGRLDPSGWVFPSWKVKGTALKDIRKAMAPVHEEFGMILTPHDYRRTYISSCSILGIDPHIAMRLVNHSTGNVHYGYKTFSIEELRPAVQRIAIRMCMDQEDLDIRDPEWEQEMEMWAQR